MTTLKNLNATLNANDQFSYEEMTQPALQILQFQYINPTSFVPASDCSSLASPYTPSATVLWSTTSNNSFNVNCDTDHFDMSADLMSFTAFTFEDCITTCASYNQRVPSLRPSSTCYSVSFDHGVGEDQGPNCLMKGIQNLAPSSRPGVSSSAVLITTE